MPESTKELSGAELDRAVAEHVMGWTRKPNGMMHGKAQEVFVDDRDNTYSIRCGCAEDFNPSCDIEAAMQVVEKIRQSNEFCCINIHSDHNYVWRVSLIRVESQNASHGVTASATNESLPLAICRAALAAIGSKE
jgi:hypothetical protein